MKPSERIEADLVLYHANCIDGFTSAFCAWRNFGDVADYVAVQYGEQAPAVAGRNVLIVDFSYPRETLLEMRAAAKSLRVFDHHATAQADLAGLDFCVFDMERSGAGITYDELSGPRRSTEAIHDLVAYVEDRDLWRFQLPHSREINAFIGSFEQTFDNWYDIAILFANEPGKETAIAGGSSVLRATERYVAEMAKQARPLRFAGYEVPIVNAPYINTSELVGHLAKGQPFAVGWFQRGDGKYQYSLRSRGDFDVSQIAKEFGGGGHKNAAGFVRDERVHP